MVVKFQEHYVLIEQGGGKCDSISNSQNADTVCIIIHNVIRMNLPFVSLFCLLFNITVNIFVMCIVLQTWF